MSPIRITVASLMLLGSLAFGVWASLAPAPEKGMCPQDYCFIGGRCIACP